MKTKKKKTNVYLTLVERLDLPDMLESDENLKASDDIRRGMEVEMRVTHEKHIIGSSLWLQR